MNTSPVARPRWLPWLGGALLLIALAAIVLTNVLTDRAVQHKGDEIKRNATVVTARVIGIVDRVRGDSFVRVEYELGGQVQRGLVGCRTTFCDDEYVGEPIILTVDHTHPWRFYDQDGRMFISNAPNYPFLGYFAAIVASAGGLVCLRLWWDSRPHKPRRGLNIDDFNVPMRPM